MYTISLPKARPMVEVVLFRQLLKSPISSGKPKFADHPEFAKLSLLSMWCSGGGRTGLSLLTFQA
jgi:hypothetical protein